ncbi:protein Iojap-related mitochondrial [Tripterygium wilfordii]|uniref:Protein Iojap-related mitochondrial n=1 Tax=Tripterygium wilfordii TaxID=458696 RepID=A0A7J7D498_TRIWF|nr:protein Iojap-related mitochondrial [Tripterygium wilfordii]
MMDKYYFFFFGYRAVFNQRYWRRNGESYFLFVEWLMIMQAKQKQRGAGRVVLPSVQGQEGGKWIVVDSGKIIVHALDEKARAYYNLESLWNTETSPKDSIQDLEKAFVKIRPKNNSKKPMRRSA